MEPFESASRREDQPKRLAQADRTVLRVDRYVRSLRSKPASRERRPARHGVDARAQWTAERLRRTAAVARRSHSARAIVPTGPEPTMPLATFRIRGFGGLRA